MNSAEENTTARKRLRTGDNEAVGAEAAAVSTVRSSDFYYTDGSIVLRAASKDGRVHTLFRVHKSILAQHCAVFRGMFGEEDAVYFAGVSEQVDGVSLVHLHDETEDVEDFLRALYDPEFMQRHNNPKHYGLEMRDFPRMYHRAMRLAKKYQAERLCAIFASALRQAWPAQWDVQEARWRASSRMIVEDESFERHEYHPAAPNPAWTVRMAVDHGVPDVLPYAFREFYEYIAPDPTAMKPDGQDARTHDAMKDVSILNPDEVLCLMLGGRRLAAYVYQHIANRPVPDVRVFPVPPSKTHTCYTLISRYWEEGQKTFLSSLVGAFNPYVVIWTASEKLNTCPSCKDALQKTLDEMGKDIWNKLPVFFRLENGAE